MPEFNNFSNDAKLAYQKARRDAKLVEMAGGTGRVVKLDSQSHSDPRRLDTVSFTGGSENLIDVDRWGKSHAKFENYKGISGNEDRLAKQQSAFEQISNGLMKNVSKAGLYIADNTVGLVVGAAQGISEGRWSGLWDNDFSNAIDDVSKSLDRNLANYRTDDEKNMNILQKVLSPSAWSNFIFDDIAHGAAFIVGAALPSIATTVLTGGAGGVATFGRIGATSMAKSSLKTGVKSTASALAKGSLSTAKKEALSVMRGVLRGGDDVVKSGLSSIDDIAKGASKKSFIDKGINFTATSGRLAQSTFFEAGMEARQNFHDSIDGFMDEFYKENGRQANSEEVTKFIKSAERSSTGLFMGNVGLLSLTNAAMFGKSLGINGVGANTITNSVNKKLFGIGVDKTLEKGVMSSVKANKLQKTLGKAYFIGRKPFSEGIVEEGLQGVMGKVSQDYTKAKYKGDDSYNFVSSLSNAIGEQYGTKEGWNEIGVGMIIGMIGGNFTGNWGVEGFTGDSTYSHKIKTIDTGVETRNKFVDQFRTMNRSNSLFNAGKNKVETEDGTSLNQTEIFEDVVSDLSYIKANEGLKGMVDLKEDYNSIVDSLEIDQEQLDASGISDIETYKTKLKDNFSNNLDIYNQAKKFISNVGVSNHVNKKGNVFEIEDAIITSFMFSKKSKEQANKFSENIVTITGDKSSLSALSFYNTLTQAEKDSVDKLKKQHENKNNLKKEIVSIQSQIEEAKSDPNNAEKTKQLSKKYVVTTNQIQRLDETISLLTNSLQNKFDSVKQGDLSLYSDYSNIDDVLNVVDKVGSYAETLRSSGRTADANIIEHNLEQFNVYSQTALDTDLSLGEMLDTNFFTKKKGKDFINKILGDPYTNPKVDKDTELYKAYKDMEDDLIKTAGKFGYSVADVDDVISSIENNDDLSDREKNKINTMVRTFATHKAIMERQKELSSNMAYVLNGENNDDAGFLKTDDIESHTVDSENIKGDTVVLRRPLSKDKKPTNNEALKELIDEIAELSDILANAPTSKEIEELAKKQKELENKKKEIESLMNELSELNNVIDAVVLDDVLEDSTEEDLNDEELDTDNDTEENVVKNNDDLIMLNRRLKFLNHTLKYNSSNMSESDLKNIKKEIKDVTSRIDAIDGGYRKSFEKEKKSVLEFINDGFGDNDVVYVFPRTGYKITRKHVITPDGESIEYFGNPLIVIREHFVRKNKIDKDFTINEALGFGVDNNGDFIDIENEFSDKFSISDTLYDSLPERNGYKYRLYRHKNGKLGYAFYFKTKSKNGVKYSGLFFEIDTKKDVRNEKNRNDLFSILTPIIDSYINDNFTKTKGVYTSKVEFNKRKKIDLSFANKDNYEELKGLIDEDYDSYYEYDNFFGDETPLSKAEDLLLKELSYNKHDEIKIDVLNQVISELKGEDVFVFDGLTDNEAQDLVDEVLEDIENEFSIEGLIEEYIKYEEESEFGNKAFAEILKEELKKYRNGEISIEALGGVFNRKSNEWNQESSEGQTRQDDVDVEDIQQSTTPKEDDSERKKEEIEDRIKSVTEEINNLEKDISEIKRPFKFTDTDGYKRYTELTSKPRKDRTQEEWNEINKLKIEIDNWITIMGVESEGLSYSDLVEQSVELEMLVIDDNSNIQEITAEDIEINFQEASRSASSNVKVGLNYNAVTSVIKTNQAGDDYTEISNISIEALEEKSGIVLKGKKGVKVKKDTKSIQLSEDVVNEINKKGNVLIRRESIQGTFYTPLLQRSVDVNKNVTYIPLKSNFYENEPTQEINDNSIYELEYEEGVKFAVDPNDPWNVDLLDRLAKEMSVMTDEEISQEAERLLPLRLKDNPTYNKLTKKLLQLENAKSKDLAKIEEYKLLIKNLTDEYYDSIKTELKTNNTTNVVSDELINDINNTLKVMIVDNKEDRNVGVLKASRDSKTDLDKIDLVKLQSIRAEFAKDLNELLDMRNTKTKKILDLGATNGKVLPGFPNYNFEDNNGQAVRVERTITSNDARKVFDTGYIHNGNLVMKDTDSSKYVDTSFVKNQIKEASNKKTPVVILRMGNTLIAYPVSLEKIEKVVTPDDMRNIFNNATLSNKDKAIQLNELLAKAGIDVTLYGNAFISVDSNGISEEFFNEKVSQLENKEIYANIESFVDKSISKENAIVGSLININLSQPFYSPKVKLNFKGIKIDVALENELKSKTKGKKSVGKQASKLSVDSKKFCGS